MVKLRFCNRRWTFARSSIDFVAGAALSQAVSASWGMARCRKRWRCGLPDSAQTTAAATPVRGQSWNVLGTVSERSWNGLGTLSDPAARQAQHFCKVRYGFGSKSANSNLAKPSRDRANGPASKPVPRPFQDRLRTGVAAKVV